jgi:hypothetical protein
MNTSARRLRYSYLLFFAVFMLSASSVLGAVGTKFTYQGRIAQAGTGVTGPVDFEFALYDDPNAGTQVGPTIQRDDVPASDGLFTTDLDFGDVFNGQKLWLEIRVSRDYPTEPYTTLTPRQELTPTPYAMWADDAGNAAFAADSDLLDGNDSSAFSLTGHTHTASQVTGIPNGFVVFGAADTSLTGESDFTYNSATNNLSISGNMNVGGVYQINNGTVLRVSDANNNTFVGLSGNGTTTGTNNTAVGDTALVAVTNGASNTAVGASALAAVTGGVDPAGTRNTAVGASSLAADTTGYANTAVGLNTLAANTTGFANVAMGAFALIANVGGFGNIAIGVQALQTATATSGNVAIGLNSQQLNNGGIDNTGVGTATLAKVVTGNSNSAFGTNALANNTASDNTAVGSQALVANTTGTGNTAVGKSTLAANQSGNQNTAMGQYALDAITTTSNDTAIGFQALTANSGGDNHTAVGSNALAGLTGGFRNTAVGSSAGQVLATGSDNIYIGYQAGLSHTGSESNNIIIGSPGSAGDNNRIRIGTIGVHNNVRIIGIFGATISASGLPVYVDGNGQLGTVLSSARFKEDIHDEGSASDQLLRLRPVVFKYKKEFSPDDRTDHYGLIAEEVEKVNPDWVVRDNAGQIMTVRYDQVNAALLGLVQRQNGEIQELSKQLNDLSERLARIEANGTADAKPTAPRNAAENR